MLNNGRSGKGAKTLIQSVLSEYGESSCRPLATVYYSLMDDAADSFVNANRFDVREEYLFPGEVLPAPDTSGASGESVSPTAPGPK